MTDAMVAKLGGTVPPPSFGDLVDVDFEDAGREPALLEVGLGLPVGAQRRRARL